MTSLKLFTVIYVKRRQNYLYYRYEALLKIALSFFCTQSEIVCRRHNLPPDWNMKLEERSPLAPQGSEGSGEIQLKREVSVQFSSCKSFHFPPFCSLGSKTLIPVLYASFLNC